MRDRLRADFQLTLTLTFGMIAVLSIAPFGVYRFMQGNLLMGLVDMAILATLILGSLYAWRTGHVRGVAWLMAASCSAGCVMVTTVSGLAPLMWAYPTLLANFLLIDRRGAAAQSALFITVIAFTDQDLSNFPQKALFLMTTLVTCLFAYVFAWRTESQRTRLEMAAAHDPLTGAHNRRNMVAELTSAISASIRDSTPVGLLIFDLDHFKSINDSFGHDAGDRVLVEISELVRSTTRKHDRLFRIGGEEFGLLVPNTDARTLLGIAEKLRIAVERQIHCEGRTVTISVGAAPYCPDESAGSWQRRADLAMYRAKRGGRNCSVLDDGCDEGCDDASSPMPGNDDGDDRVAQSAPSRASAR